MVQNVPQRATWMATGNNLKVGGDLARRCYWIRMDAKVARPWQRDGFRHADLLKYVQVNRGRLLAAVLTLARAWFAAGCPRADLPRLGGFEGWTTTVGGVLAHAGIEGFLGNLDDLYQQVDEDELAWETLLARWFKVYGTREMTVAELTADLRVDGSQLRDVLPGDLAEALTGKGSFERRLGKALSKRAAGIYGKFRLERAGTNTTINVIRWKVIEAPDGVRRQSLPDHSGP